MLFALRWVFPDPGTVIVQLFGTLLLASWLFDKFNHQTRDKKILNTKIFLACLVVDCVRSAYLEWVNHDMARIWIPMINNLAFWATVILSDWITLWLNMAGHHEGGLGGFGLYHLGRLWRSMLAGAGRLLIAAMLISGAIVACLAIPSPPQLTAGALNSTYEADSSATSSALTMMSPGTDQASPASTEAQSPTPTSSPTPSPSPTSSIEEVTATRTIIEVSPLAGPSIPPAGIPRWEAGAYIPWRSLYVRTCGSLTCDIAPGSGLAAYVEIKTIGLIRDYDDSIWVCMAREIDPGPGGAELCTRAALRIGTDGIELGYYRVTE